MDEELENLKRCLRRCATHAGVPWEEGKWDEIPEAISDKVADAELREATIEQWLILLASDGAILFPKKISSSVYDQVHLTHNEFGWSASMTKPGEDAAITLARSVNDKDVSVYFATVYELLMGLYDAGWSKL